MARHSHWHNIQITKGKADARKAKIFARFARLITVAAREGGGDPLFNVRLRVAIEAAKGVSMPKENIDRAVARGTGAGGEAVLEEVVYEAYAPGKIACLIACTTDNRNRTNGEVRSAVGKAGGTVAPEGSFSWIFSRKAVLALADVQDIDTLTLALIDAGADVVEDEGGGELYVEGPVQALSALVQEATRMGVRVVSAERRYVPKDPGPVPEERAGLDAFLTRVDDLDDVDEVFLNIA